MKNISFATTTDQVIRREKAVTRRFGWGGVEPDQHLQGVNKCQGLKPGEHPVKLAEIIVLDSQWEPLNEIIKRPVRKAKSAREWAACRRCCRFAHYHLSKDEWTCGSGANLEFCCGYTECPGIHDVDLEGFSHMTPVQFVEMLLRSNRKATEETPVNRIVFEYASNIQSLLQSATIEKL
jgi:hypothetical protein